MARKILVADRDPVYADALAKRIRKHCPACDVVTASDEPAFQCELAQAGVDLSLVVSAAHFPVDSLPAGVSQLILLETRLGPDAVSVPGQPVRLGPVQPILEQLDSSGCRQAERLDEVVAAEANPVDMRPAIPATTASAAAAAADASTGVKAITAEEPPKDQRVILMLTQTVTGRHPSYADQRCLELGADGESVGYLPLMPNYYCRFATGFGSGNGNGLTNLILRIACGGMPAAELGAYMAIDSLGRMQVRPSDRADDLLDCQPHPAFQLVTQLREWTLAEPRALLVIEAAGVPFRLMQAIVPLCDAVEVIMPDDEGYAGQALRREIADVLIELPAGARVRQVPERQISGKPVSAKTVAGLAPIGRETPRGRHVPA